MTAAGQLASLLGFCMSPDIGQGKLICWLICHLCLTTFDTNILYSQLFLVSPSCSHDVQPDPSELHYRQFINLLVMPAGHTVSSEMQALERRIKLARASGVMPILVLYGVCVTLVKQDMVTASITTPSLASSRL